MSEPAVAAAGIHKRFGSTRALRGVDLALEPGRCLGLVGRNGAGKSTLVSILSGIYPPDAGEVRLNAPLATVFQHSMVVPGMTVGENVFLGRQPRRHGGIIDWRRMREQAERVMADWGFEVSASTPCGNLTVEQRQVVEIVRALAAGTRCLLLDEPTAALERGATERLFERIRQLRTQGVAIMYISHHLEEVFEICTDVAVLRDGEKVLAGPLDGVAEGGSGGAIPPIRKADLVTAMVGNAKPPHHAPAAARAATKTGPALAAEGITATTLRDVTLTIRPAERVGVTGLRGSGATELARIVAGAATATAGTVRLGGKPLKPGDRVAALRAGIGYIPEDRQADGFVPRLGAAENIAMTVTDRIANAGFIGPKRREALAAPLARRLSLVSAGLGQPVGELSGGNQQKVTVARALASDPRLIVAVTPTRGVDVASKELLLGELARVTEQTGASLLLATDELDDLVICDRVVVLVRGEVFAEFTDPPFDREALIGATEGIASHD